MTAGSFRDRVSQALARYDAAADNVDGIAIVLAALELTALRREVDRAHWATLHFETVGQLAGTMDVNTSAEIDWAEVVSCARRLTAIERLLDLPPNSATKREASGRRR